MREPWRPEKARAGSWQLAQLVPGGSDRRSSKKIFLPSATSTGSSGGPCAGRNRQNIRAARRDHRRARKVRDLRRRPGLRDGRLGRRRRLHPSCKPQTTARREPIRTRRLSPGAAGIAASCFRSNSVTGCCRRSRPRLPPPSVQVIWVPGVVSQTPLQATGGAMLQTAMMVPFVRYEVNFQFFWPTAPDAVHHHEAELLRERERVDHRVRRRQVGVRVEPVRAGARSPGCRRRCRPRRSPGGCSRS